MFQLQLKMKSKVRLQLDFTPASLTISKEHVRCFSSKISTSGNFFDSVQKSVKSLNTSYVHFYIFKYDLNYYAFEHAVIVC